MWGHLATLEIIRFDTEHYFTVTVGNQVAKYVYSCPSLAGTPTYPGVYSQRQRLYVSEFEATSNVDEVIAKLNNFQKAATTVKLPVACAPIVSTPPEEMETPSTASLSEKLTDLSKVVSGSTSQRQGR
mgnify:CR=1 FL=1